MFNFSSSNSSKSANLFGGEERSSSSQSILPTFQDEPACAKCCPNLTYKQRIIGFVSCTAFGYLLSIIGTLTLLGGMSPNNIRLFIGLYVVGNVVSLMSTGFLCGPKKQCIKMWDATRRFSTAFYLSMLIIVFAVAVSKQNVFLVLFLLIVEMIAGAWYSLSYIPYGRKMALTCMRSTGVCYPCFACSDAIADAKKTVTSSSSSSGSMFKGNSK